MEITLSSGKKVEFRELKFLQSAKLEKIKESDIVAKELMKQCTNLTEQEQEDLSVKDGIAVMEAIYQINGLKMPEDFQKSRV